MLKRLPTPLVEAAGARRKVREEEERARQEQLGRKFVGTGKLW
jgi:hypothetical protein